MSAPQGPASFPFDARPLTAPVDRAAVTAFTQQLRAQGRIASSFSAGTAVALIVGGVVALFVLSTFVSVFVGIIGAFASSFASNGSGMIFASLFPIIPILFIATIGTLIAVRAFGGFRGAGERRYRLDRFAQANGMTYLPEQPAPALPGMIFSQGSSRQATDLVRGERPRFVEFANYRYTTGSGKNKSTHRWGYVAVRLDVPLPHIVLDAKSNNGLFGSNLPASFDPAQRLSLEGDFDRYFSLSCPRGYEADALYLFTPDIMARFIDNAAALDVEIVDDWLFLYAKRDFSTLDPATWAWLFSVVGALLDKLAQWARWRDERLAATLAAQPALAAEGGAGEASVPFAAPAGMLRPPPGVAPPGRRLKTHVPVWVWILFGGMALFWLASQTGVLGVFLGFLR